MAAGTVENVWEVPNSGMEVVRLNISDGDTYVSRKFATIQQALVSSNSNNDADINVTYSGATATINYASQSKKDVTLVLFGE